MTNKIEIRGTVIGEGKPKICVPIAARTRDELRKRTAELKASGPDVAEWRADWYEGVLDGETLSETLEFLRSELKSLPLLVTFRSKNEGGEQDITPEEYLKLLEKVISLGCADLIDVELSFGEELFAGICGEAHDGGVYVVGSSHDFEKTPEKQEIIDRLCRMQDLGADLLKLAAMPQSEADVLTLLAATCEMRDRYAHQPLITMSMGASGSISRICGEVFGSALTFATAGVSSAPGQIPVSDLKTALDIVHRSL